MLEHVLKHPAVAAERFRASLGLVWVIGRLVSTDVNVTGQAGTGTIHRENSIPRYNPVTFCYWGGN